MKTILVPLDGSVRAEQIMPYVRRLASLLDARLRLLQVVPDTVQDELFAETVAEAYHRGPGPTAVQRGRDWSSWETRLRHAEGYLESQASMVRSAGIAVDGDAHLGDPAESIVEAAEQQHAALIALATHGYSGIKRWALGSVADKVLHATTTPLVLVHACAA